MGIKTFTATKAFLNYNGKILILRESKDYEEGTNKGKYDVVGGRVKPGEKWDKSLLREISEERGLTAKIGSPFYVNEWRPTVNREEWQIIGVFLECFTDSDKVVLGKDHDDYKWINPEEHKNYNLIENLHEVFDAYLSFQTSTGHNGDK